MTPAPVYRQDFLAQHSEEREIGEPLRLGSSAVTTGYFILLLVTAIGLAWLALGRVRETAIGPAELRASSMPGTIAVFAEFPGRWRKQLHSGQPLQIKFPNYPGHEITVPIAEIGAPAAAPSASGHGEENLVVRATLDHQSFRWRGRDCAYAPGMVGRAMVVIRDDRLMSLLRRRSRAAAESSHD